MFTEEMQKALEADGEKLRQLTGEDHGPHFPEFMRQRSPEDEPFKCPEPITCQFPACDCGPVYGEPEIPSSRTLIQEALIGAKIELEYLVKVADANKDNGPVVRGHKETLELIARAIQALPTLPSG